jgi:AraC family transcriptional regulator
MARSFREMQPVLAHVGAYLTDDLSLESLAAETGLSPFHLHRVFTAVVGETPKQLTFRLRLGRAAVLLLTTDDSVLDIALACGFRSHEVFCRAFRRRFDMTPSAYRKRGFVHNADASQAREHAGMVDKIGPCVGLYYKEEARSKKSGMTYSITKKTLAPQPVLVVRRTVKRSEIAATIGETLPRIFQYAQQNGIALVGPPFTRYLEIGPGLLTMEPGMCVAAGTAEPKTSADGEIASDTLPGGLVATTTHAGPYDQLSDAYAAIQEWAKAEGLVTGQGLWEVYVTDPADFPDPKDWRTEVFWPLG